VTALALDKDYRQDQALDWGHLTRPEIGHGPSQAAAAVAAAARAGAPEDGSGRDAPHAVPQGSDPS